MRKAFCRSFLGMLAVGTTFILIAGCRENSPDNQTVPPSSSAPSARPVGNIKPANPGKVVEGSALNKIFPPSVGGTK
jgi:hypothetical protein